MAVTKLGNASIDLKKQIEKLAKEIDDDFLAMDDEDKILTVLKSDPKWAKRYTDLIKKSDSEK